MNNIDDKSETPLEPIKNPARAKGIAKVQANYKIPVVGIGASVGGLEALEQFFSNMPSITGMAFVDSEHEKKQFKTKIFSGIKTQQWQNCLFCSITLVNHYF